MPDNEITDVIKRIIEKREGKGYSYQDLSDKTGINKSTLMRYEKGIIKNLSLDKLELIAIALGVTPGYLMGWEIPQEYTDKYKVTSKDKAQYMEFMKNEAEAFFMDDKFDDEDKKEILDTMNEIFWKAKTLNKRKPKNK